MPGQTTTCSGNKPPRRNERRKARDRKRWPDRTSHAAPLYARVLPDEIGFVYFVYACMGVSACKPCYDFSKPKGPVRKNTSDHAVAAPTEKRGFVMSEFVRSGVARCGMVLGRWACPRGWPHGVIRVLNICPPAARKNATSGFLSHHGAKTMTQAFATVRTAAPIQSQADITDPHVIALHAAAENALSMALSMLRNPAGTAADLQRATGRVIRAGTLMRRACAAQEGGAA